MAYLLPLIYALSKLGPTLIALLQRKILKYDG